MCKKGDRRRIIFLKRKPNTMCREGYREGEEAIWEEAKHNVQIGK
jgi:hypothetical protein